MDEICTGDSPRPQSIQQACYQLGEIAERMYPQEIVIEWNSEDPKCSGVEDPGGDQGGTFDRIGITLDNGKVRTLHKIDHPDISMSIDAFVKEHPYQSLNIAVRQGGVASLERRDAERLD